MRPSYAQSQNPKIPRMSSGPGIGKRSKIRLIRPPIRKDQRSVFQTNFDYTKGPPPDIGDDESEIFRQESSILDSISQHTASVYSSIPEVLEQEAAESKRMQTSRKWITTSRKSYQHAGVVRTGKNNAGVAEIRLALAW